MSSTLAPEKVEVVERPGGADQIEHDRPWVVIVWNDPINLMSYVTLVCGSCSATAGRRRRG